MFRFLQQGKTLGVQLLCFFWFSFAPGDVSQVLQYSSDVGRVFFLTKESEAPVVKRCRAFVIALKFGDLAKVVQRNGFAEFVLQRLKHPSTLFEARVGTIKISLRKRNQGAVIDRRGDREIIPEFASDRDTLLMERS